MGVAFLSANSLITAAEDKSIRLWSRSQYALTPLGSPIRLYSHKADAGQFESLSAFARPDGTITVSVGESRSETTLGALAILNLNADGSALKLVGRTEYGSEFVRSVDAFSKGDLAAALSGSELTVWNTKDLSQVSSASLKQMAPASVRQLSISAEGNAVAVVGHNATDSGGVLQILPVKDGRIGKPVIIALADCAEAVAWQDAGHVLISTYKVKSDAGAAQCKVLRCSVAEGTVETVAALSGTPRAVISFALSRDRRRGAVLASSLDGPAEVRVFDAESLKLVKSVEEPGPARSIALSPTGAVVALGMQDGDVRLEAAEGSTPEDRRTFTAPEKMAWNADSKSFITAVGGKNYQIDLTSALVDDAPGTMPSTPAIDTPFEPVNDFTVKVRSFTFDRLRSRINRIISVDNDRALVETDAEIDLLTSGNKKPLPLSGIEGGFVPGSVAVSPGKVDPTTDRAVAIICRDHTVRLWVIGVNHLSPVMTVFIAPPHTPGNDGDTAQWIVWNDDSGFYNCSPGAAGLVGFHVNGTPNDLASFQPLEALYKDLKNPGELTAIVSGRPVGSGGLIALAHEPVIQAKLYYKDAPVQPDSDGVYRIKGQEVEPEVLVEYAVLKDGSALENPEVKGVVNRGVPRSLVEVSRQSKLPPPAPNARRSSKTITTGDNELALSLPNHPAASTVMKIHYESTDAQKAEEVAPMVALCLGIGDYEDPDLKIHGNQDAERIAAMLRSRLSPEDVVCLLDKDVTLARIHDAVEKLNKRVEMLQDGHAEGSVNFVLYISSHGYADVDPKTKLPRFYIPCVNAKSNDIPGTSILWDSLMGEVNRVNSRNLIIFADNCFSGAVAKSEQDRVALKGTEGELKDQQHARHIFAAVSSAANQKSLEDKKWAFDKDLKGVDPKQERVGGVFTYGLLNLFRGDLLIPGQRIERPVIKFSDILNNLGRIVKSATGDRQQPLVWCDSFSTEQLELNLIKK